jgi:hypothetical protein
MSDKLVGEMTSRQMLNAVDQALAGKWLRNSFSLNPVR